MSPPSTLDDDRWERVDALFQAALDRTPRERRAFLEGAAGDDPDLRDEVLALLAAGERETGALNADGVWTEVLEEIEAEVRLQPGDEVGRFRLIDEIGRGGMSTVYLARRHDGSFEQQVAIKVLRGDLHSEQLADRLRAERQILARLNHPGIARVFDGGMTDDGRPYLVSEFVDGQAIDTFADGRRLPVPDRLRLFIEVGRAVGYAHRNLVVHRDIKPSNILVAKDGRPKLLDFGIAKLLDEGEGLEGERPALTVPGMGWMTPEYAAPEQIRGEPITAATDVYSLGVLLYELLSGHSPYGVDTRTPYALQKAVCETQPRSLDSAVLQPLPTGGDDDPILSPEALSAARSTDPSRLSRTLDGDLDAIVMKALRKEPDERYDTVYALVEDVEAFLAGRPVSARTGTIPYRARKFLRRNRVVASVATGFTLALAVGSVALGVQRNRAVAAAAAADREAANAQRVSTFLADIFRQVDPTSENADSVSARALLMRGADRVERELGDQPEVQVELYGVIGRSLGNLGFVDSAIEIHRRSLVVARRALGPDSEELEGAINDLAASLVRNRDFPGAMPLVNEVVEMRRRRLGEDHLAYGQSLLGLANRVRDVIGPDSAESVIRRALAVEGLAGDSAAQVNATSALAYVLRAQGKLDEAESLYREVLPHMRAGAPSGDLALALNNLAYVMREQGDYDEAASLYQEAHRVHSTIHGTGHPTSLMIAQNLGGSLTLAGRDEEADSVFMERVSAAEAQWPEGHWRVASAYEAAALGRLTRRGSWPSVELARAALEGYEEALGQYHAWTITARVGLGVALLDDGDEGGIQLIGEALGSMKIFFDRGNALGPDEPFKARRYAEALELRGYDEAADVVREIYRLDPS